MTTATAELATLLPCLAAALPRDNTIEGRGGITAGSVVNPEVLHAMDRLRREIPPATMRASRLAGEPWQPRQLAECLLALERFIGRIYQLGPPADAMALEDEIRGWIRVTKQALGLRTPDIPLGCTCPACGHGRLLAAGSEGFLRRNGHGLTVEWEHAGRVYCTMCTAVWGVAEWPLLGRVLETA